MFIIISRLRLLHVPSLCYVFFIGAILNFHLGISGAATATQEKQVSIDIQQQSDPLIHLLRSSDYITKVEAAQAVEAQPTAGRIRALLMETANCVDHAIRVELLKIVGRTDAATYADELIEVFGQWKDGDLREAARIAILRSPSALTIDKLVNLANSRTGDQKLLRDIGRTLSNIRNPQTAQRLLAEIYSPHTSIAAGSAAALAAIGNDEAVRGLVNAYPELDSARKEFLLEAISRIRNIEALPALVEALSANDIDAGLRTTIGRTVNIIQGGQN